MSTLTAILLAHVRLRRYRTPLKLIYCCGLRLGECLSLTIHDILGDENKLWVRNGKGHQDRLLPLPGRMVRELRRYWAFHRHPLLIFPNVGRGNSEPQSLADRMRRAKTPMPYSSLQRLVLVARKELNLPSASVHTLRQSFDTHLLEARPLQIRSVYRLRKRRLPRKSGPLTRACSTTGVYAGFAAIHPLLLHFFSKFFGNTGVVDRRCGALF
ncbi:MAG TPA: tyrosine-type recombinase/integrase [Chthoniobacterales bacterium]